VHKKWFRLLGDFDISALSNNSEDQQFMSRMQCLGAHQMIIFSTRFLHEKSQINWTFLL